MLAAICSDNHQMYQLGLLLTPDELVIVRGRPTVFFMLLSPFILPVAELLSFLFGAGSKAWQAYEAGDITGLRGKTASQFCSFIPRSAIREARIYRKGSTFAIKADKNQCAFGRRSPRLPRWLKQTSSDIASFQAIRDALQRSK